MVAVLTASIADDTVTFDVEGARGPLSVRWGDGTDGVLSADGGEHVYGDGEFLAVVVDGTTGQRMTQAVMVPAPGVPVVDAVRATDLPTGPPSDTNLHIYGSGFGRCSVIRFGNELETAWTARGLAYRGPNELVLEITGGLFPDPDDVPVSVITPVPGGGESSPENFSFTDGGSGPSPGEDIVVASFTPASVSVDEGFTSVATGSGFSVVTMAMFFDDVASVLQPLSTFTVDSDTQITIDQTEFGIGVAGSYLLGFADDSAEYVFSTQRLVVS